MAEQKHDLAKLFVTQKSLTEWLEDIKHSRAAEIRQDDNDKRDRGHDPGVMESAGFRNGGAAFVWQIGNHLSISIPARRAST